MWFLYPGPSGGWCRKPACLFPLCLGVLSARSFSVLSLGPGVLGKFSGVWPFMPVCTVPCASSLLSCFYSVLGAVLLNYRVNIDLTVFLVHIWWQNKTEISFPYKCSPRKQFHFGMTDSWCHQELSLLVYHVWVAGQQEGSQNRERHPTELGPFKQHSQKPHTIFHSQLSNQSGYMATSSYKEAWRKAICLS